MKFDALVVKLSHKYLEQSPDKESYVRNAMEARADVSRFSLDDYNEAVRREVAGSGAEWEPLQGISEKERLKRRQLSHDITEKAFKKIADRLYSGFPTDTLGVRYVQEFIFDTGDPAAVGEKNRESYSYFEHPAEHQSDLIRVHYDYLRKIDRLDLTPLTRELSDQELYDNFEMITELASLFLQFSNMKKFFKENIKEPENDTDRKRMDEIGRIMTKLDDFSDITGILNARIGAMINPWYEVADTNSVNALVFAQAASETLIPGLPGETPFTTGTASDGTPTQQCYSGGLPMLISEVSQLGLQGDLRAVEKEIALAGKTNGEFRYRFINGDTVSEPKPFSTSGVTMNFYHMPRGRIEIYEEANPENKFTISGSTHGELMQQYLKGKTAAPEPPKKPGFWKSFMHWINPKYYAEDFQKYERETYVYQYSKNQKSETNEALTGVSHPDVPDQNSAGGAENSRMRIRQKQNAAIIGRLNEIGDEEFTDSIRSVLNDTSDMKLSEEVRAKLAAASAEEWQHIHASYQNGTKDNLHEKLSFFEPAQSRQRSKSVSAPASEEKKAEPNSALR